MIKFTKMEGLGNDYIYIYSENKIENINDLAIKMSDRHFGIGGDGIIIIGPSNNYDFKFEMYNSDGSQAEMCGNGIRCAAKFVYEKGYTKKTEIDFETLAGKRHVSLILENDTILSVKVDMGKPILKADDIPVSEYEEKKNYENLEMVQFSYDINGDKKTFSCVSMGNPHTVCFLDNISEFDITKYGPNIENDSRFPNKTNVEFVEIIDRNKIKMRVWERGAGETLACGTGACASTVASIINGYTERKVEVNLLGGTLLIEWAEDGHVYMTGPANTVFEGEYEEIKK